MKSIIKVIYKVTAFFLLLFILFLSYATLTDFQPKEKIQLFKQENAREITNNNFTILSWNIGYAGLGDNMDFLYDGGNKVKDTEKRTIKNLNNIIEFLSAQGKLDFMLLQEVDVKAKRSYYINQRDSIENKFRFDSRNSMAFLSIFAYNYNVPHVPVPFTEPMGYVHSGLQSLSKYVPTNSTRFAFPGNYSWPKSLFMLDRCFLSNRYKLKNGKELIIINTHNSAFDDGSLKKQQLESLRKYLLTEVEKGNYFVVGGDWNQNPPGLNTNKFSKYDKSKEFKLSMINKDIFPANWQWVFDPNIATNRSNITAYKKGESATTVLDFFLISPNLEANFITTIDLDFKNSDHQPVIMNFRIIN